MERFHLSKDRVGSIFSKAGEHSKMSTYILNSWLILLLFCLYFDDLFGRID
jgi:hypothetical protein